jgi:SnoaL-like domain
MSVAATDAAASVADRLELEQVVWTLGRSLDERDFEGLRRLFTADATVTTAKTASGHDALVEQARRRHTLDDSVQHIITNLIIDLHGDQATGRANLLVSFAHTGPADPAPFLVGEVYRFTFQRTLHGWRIATLTSTTRWSLNQPSR